MPAMRMPVLQWRLLSLAALVFDVIPVLGDNITGPVSHYYSRTDLQAPFLNVTLYNDSYVSPGYIFLAPYQVDQPGPYIYDAKGNLVWSGFAVSGPGPSHDFHVCEYDESPHLCFFTGYQYLGYARGHGVILDSSFRTVSTVASQGGVVPSDQHEFNVVDGGKSALVTVYEDTMYDLSAYGIAGGQGWIMNNFAQDVDTATGKLLWSWSALNHVDPSASYMVPNSTQVSGTGFSRNSSWDYFHINSIDKDDNGDYLISSRHTSCIYKVSGNNGSILWRLGGMQSDFTVAGFNFSYQHDARFISENASTAVISFFDNNSDGFTFNAPYSQGLVVKLDKANMVATAVRRYPALNLTAASQGNLQLLPDGNAFLGWGNNAWVTEHTEDGNMVFAATFASTGALHYRAYKFNFTTHPTDAPTAFAYAHNTSAPTTYWMSWNGATAAAKWRVYITADPATEPVHLLATVPKEGFETSYTAPHYHPWCIIEAVAANGTGLANSTTFISTFVPSEVLADSCNDEQCPLVTEYSSQPTILAAEQQGSPTLTTTPTPSRTITVPPSSSTSATKRPSTTSAAASAKSSEAKQGAAVALSALENVNGRWSALVVGVGVVAGGMWLL